MVLQSFYRFEASGIGSKAVGGPKTATFGTVVSPGEAVTCGSFIRANEGLELPERRRSSNFPALKDPNHH